MLDGGLRPGQVIGGDFRIVRLLGEGGMGAVYVAEQMSTGAHRALKVMHPSVVGEPGLHERFVQEARVGSRIQSDHVVQVVAAGVDPQTGTPWLAMELLEGNELRQAVAARPLTASETREIFAQLCHAVGAAHAAGVVHRDLKPENIFLARSRLSGQRFTVKVLDFGIAKILDMARTRMTSAMGSQYWMAPEQTQASDRVLPSTDVWALGLIAFYLLTGKLYWISANMDAASVAVLREILMDPIVPASQRSAQLGGATLPQGFDAWFARCVHRDPAQRFPTATECDRALGPILDYATNAAKSMGGTLPAQPIPQPPPAAPTGFAATQQVAYTGGPSMMGAPARTNHATVHAQIDVARIASSPSLSPYAPSGPVPGPPPPGYPHAPSVSAPFPASGSGSGPSRIVPPAPVARPKKKSSSLGLVIGLVLAVGAVVGVLAIAGVFSGKSKKTGAGSSSASGSSLGAAAPPPAPPPFTCLDLPGAGRPSVLPSPDKKSLFFTEKTGNIDFTDSIGQPGKRKRLDLFKVPVEGGTPTKLASDVEERLVVADSGEVFFRRIVKSSRYDYDTEYGLFMIGVDGRETRLSPVPEVKPDDKFKAQDSVVYFTVDSKNKQVFFLFGKYSKGNLFVVPFAGGPPRAIEGEIALVWGVTKDGQSLLLRTSAGTTALLPTSATTLSASRAIGEDGFSQQIIGDKNYYFSKTDEVVKVRKLDGTGTQTLGWTLKKDDLLLTFDERRIYVQRGAADADKVLYAGDDQAGVEIAKVAFPSRFKTAFTMGDDVGVIVQRDTSPSNDIYDDETDICIVRGKGVTLESRTVSKADLPLYAKLLPLAAADLAGARISVWHNVGDQAVFTVEGAGPEDNGQLRQRAKTLQAEVAKASGNPKLGARIFYKKNERLATAYYHPGLPDHLLNGGGPASRIQYLREQYTIEIDPSTVFSGKPGEEFGSFNCKGTVQNIGTTPITPEVKCTIDDTTIPWSGKGATTPATLQPGQTGTYDFYVGAGKRGKTNISVSISDGGKEMPFFNAYVDRLSRGL